METLGVIFFFERGFLGREGLECVVDFWRMECCWILVWIGFEDRMQQ